MELQYFVLSKLTTSLQKIFSSYQLTCQNISRIFLNSKFFLKGSVVFPRTLIIKSTLQDRTYSDMLNF